MTDTFRALCATIIATADEREGDGVKNYAAFLEALAAARAALAQSEPEPPVDGEVAELVAELRSVAKALNDEGLMGSADPCRRAADLLERLAEPEPEPPADGNHIADARKMVEPANMEVAELCVWLRANSSGIYRPAARAAELLERIPVLEAELERERIRLAACGVIAMADTPDSATAARDIAPEYQSASAQDVARMVDKLMRLRQQPPPPTQTEPEPPADGEVAELASMLGEYAACQEGAGWMNDAAKLRRAAELLKRQ